MIELIDFQEKYLKQYKEAHGLSVKQIKNGVIKEHDLIFKDPDIIDVIKQSTDNRDKSKLKPGYVTSFDYLFVNNEQLIGVIQIRTELTPALLKFGGNIGYAVNPKYWRQGYGNLLLKHGLEKAKELVQEDKVLVTCDDDNIGSYKIIEANGGILENKIINTYNDETFLTRRYWITL